MASDVMLNFVFVVSVVLHVDCNASAAKNDIRLATRSLTWDDNWYFELVEPEKISYTYKIRPAKDFGSVLNQSYYNIDLVLADPIHGCGTLTNKFFIRSNIAFIERGECSFLTKAIHAEEAGAVALIIADYDKDNDSRMVDMITDGTDRHTNIASFFLIGKDGFMIKKTLTDMDSRSAVINIPINATGIALHLLNMPPWSLW